MYHATTTTQTYVVTSNTVSNINSGTSTTYGMLINYGAAGSIGSNNTITNISSAGIIYGLNVGGTASPSLNVTGNAINSFTSTGASVVYGYYQQAGTVVNFYKNKIYNLVGNNAGSTVNGINIAGGTTYNVYNNLIGNLLTPLANGTIALSGINVAGGSNANIYYNTVYLNATSSGTVFGSSALFASTTPTLDLRNNIFVNNSTPTGTGVTVAYRRTSATLTTFSASSNNNLFYAGVPSASNIIYTDGTTPQQTLGAYKTLVTPRDAAAVTENPTFVSTTGSNTNFLNINTVTPTQIESGASPISTIADDYIGTTRNAVTPDIGAWEGNYTSSADALPPAFLASGFTSPACNLTSRTFTMNLTDVSGVASGSLSPRVYYNLNGGAYTSTQGTLSTGTATNGVWTFSLSYSGVTSDVVNYYVVAQDIASTPNLGATPSAGFAGTNVNSITTPPSSPNNYTLVGTLAGTYSVGATGTFTSLTQAANIYNISCLSGPVTFVLIDPTYSTAETFPIVFNNNPYASSTNSLLIVPASGLAVSVTGTTTATSTLKFLNSQFITINGLNTGGSSLSVSNPNTVSSAVIWLASTSSTGPGNNSTGIRNLTINGAISTSGYGIISGVDGVSPSTTAGIDNDNITIQGNKILTVNYGIYATGTATTSAGLDNWTIRNNGIGPVTSSTNNIGFQGIYLGNLNGLAVINNTISNVTGTNAYEFGLNLTSGVRNATVNLNTINSIKYTGTSGYSGIGIDVNVNNTAANITIQNNMLSDITGDGWSSFTAGGICAMRVAASNSVGGINIQNNSMAINQGTTTGNTTANVSSAIYFGLNSSNVDLRNNILYSNVYNSANAAAKTYAIYSDAPSTAFTNINYNNYYTAGAQASLALIAAASQTNLAMIVSSFGQNANSQTIAPVFTSLTDLHLIPGSNGPLDNLGTPIAGITVDIDNATRSLTTPDIGADEFTSNNCTTANGGTIATTSYSICSGQVVTLTSNSVSTGATTVYQWLSSTSPSGPFTAVTGGSGANTATFVTGALTTNTLYYQLQTTCTTLSLTANSNTVTVLINALPSISVSPSNSTYCGSSASPIALTASGASTYSWLPSAGLSGTVGTVVNATPTVGTNYTITGTDVNGCVNTATNIVNVSSPTNLDSVSISPNPICYGANANLIAYTSSPSFTYCQPVYSTGSGSGDYITGVSLSTLTNSTGALATPYYTLYPTSLTTTLTAGSTYTLNVQAGSWTGSGNNIAAFIDFNQNGLLNDASDKLGETLNLGATPAVGTITFVVPSGALNGVTRFRVREVYATTNIDPCTSATFGETEDYVVTIVGGVTPTLNYAWSPSTFLSSTSLATVTANSATLTTAYTVTVTNSGGCISSGSKTLTVSPIPTLSISGNTSACVGNTVNLTASGASTYTWNTGATTASISATPTANTTYTATGTTSLGCVGSAVQTVTINANPTVSIAGSSVICAGQTASLTASGATTYTWNTGATTSTIAPTPTTNITYTVTGASGTCTNSATKSVTVNALPGATLSANSNTACTNGANIPLSGSPSGGTYAGTNVTGSIFTPGASAGTFVPTYVYTNTLTGCSKTATTQIVVSVCTGIDSKVANSLSIQVYPNPNTGLFTIELVNGLQKTIQVTDLTGRVVLENSTNEDVFNVNIATLANGVYYVKVTSNSGTEVLKIVKQ